MRETIKENLSTALDKVQKPAVREKALLLNDYVKQCMDSFDSRPFTRADSLVLSQICYMHMEKLPREFFAAGKVSIKDLYRAEFFTPLTKGVRDEKSNLDLLFAAAASPRFRDAKIDFIHCSVDPVEEEQFFALTYFLPDGTAYIAFRGTDTSVIGWKEDFNMTFKDVIPSQATALEYLERIGKKLDCPFYIGGHSKGGNLAVYCGALCSEDLLPQIIEIFNHDGPGLTPRLQNSRQYKAVREKISVSVPVFSVFGMVYTDGDYRVVTSSKNGIMAHDPFSWYVKDGDFFWREKVSRLSEKIPDMVIQLSEKLDENRRKVLVDAIFDVVRATGATTFTDWPGAALKEVDSMINALKNLDRQTEESVKNSAVQIIKTAAENIISLPDLSSIVPEKIKNGLLGKSEQSETDNEDHLTKV